MEDTTNKHDQMLKDISEVYEDYTKKIEAIHQDFLIKLAEIRKKSDMEKVSKIKEGITK